MIKHRLFVKGEVMYALLTSNSNPNILIPVKATVQDIQHDDVNPQYIIKIIRFYDNIYFLKKYLFNMSFASNFESRPRKFGLNPDLIKSEAHLKEQMKKYDGAYNFVIDSIMCTKYRSDMIELFNKIQDFLIHKQFRELREHTTRTFYKGNYSITGKSEFEARIKRAFGDKIKNTGFSDNKFFELL